MASVITKKMSFFPKILTILIILVVLSLTKQGECVRFEIESGDTKCISEEIKTDAMSVGKYSVINPHQNHSLPHSHKLNVRDGKRLMEMLTYEEVEAAVKSRVELKAKTYGRELKVNQEDSETDPVYKMKPSLVADLYRHKIMPLTKEVQVAYLLRRLD